MLNVKYLDSVKKIQIPSNLNDFILKVAHLFGINSDFDIFTKNDKIDFEVQILNQYDYDLNVQELINSNIYILIKNKYNFQSYFNLLNNNSKKLNEIESKIKDLIKDFDTISLNNQNNNNNNINNNNINSNNSKKLNSIIQNSYGFTQISVFSLNPYNPPLNNTNNSNSSHSSLLKISNHFYTQSLLKIQVINRIMLVNSHHSKKISIRSIKEEEESLVSLKNKIERLRGEFAIYKIGKKGEIKKLNEKIKRLMNDENYNNEYNIICEKLKEKEEEFNYLNNKFESLKNFINNKWNLTEQDYLKIIWKKDYEIEQLNKKIDLLQNNNNNYDYYEKKFISISSKNINNFKNNNKIILPNNYRELLRNYNATKNPAFMNKNENNNNNNNIENNNNNNKK